MSPNHYLKITVHSYAMCLFKIYEYHKLSADATLLNTKSDKCKHQIEHECKIGYNVK